MEIIVSFKNTKGSGRMLTDKTIVVKPLYLNEKGECDKVVIESMDNPLTINEVRMLVELTSALLKKFPQLIETYAH